MEIEVHYFTVLSKITGKRQEKIQIKEGSALGGLLTILTRKYGADIERYVASGRKGKGLQLVFLLNGQNIAQRNGLETKLHDGDIVEMVPPLAGG